MDPENASSWDGKPAEGEEGGEMIFCAGAQVEYGLGI